jgi:hypothetical protein
MSFFHHFISNRGHGVELWILAGFFHASLIFVELRVSTFTVWNIIGVFALAEERVAVLFCHEAFGSEARACVRAIAEGLILGLIAVVIGSAERSQRFR